MEKPKEEQHSRVLNYDDFELVKFKVQDKGAEVAYYNIANTKLGKQTAEIKDKIHEDLVEAIEALKPIMARRIGLLVVTDHIITNLSKNKKLMEYAVKEETEQIDRCKISGIVFSGENQLKRCQITGSVKCPGYGSYGMAAPGINLVSEELGYEEDAIRKFDHITEEVYKHVFNGKRAPKAEDNQTSILDDDQNDGSADLKAI